MATENGNSLMDAPLLLVCDIVWYTILAMFNGRHAVFNVWKQPTASADTESVANVWHLLLCVH